MSRARSRGGSTRTRSRRSSRSGIRFSRRDPVLGRIRSLLLHASQQLNRGLVHGARSHAGHAFEVTERADRLLAVLEEAGWTS